MGDLRMNGAGRLPVVMLAAAFVLAGCGGSTETDTSDLRSENKDLRQENGRLGEEVQRLQGEVERLQGEVEDARETAEAEPEGSSGGGLAVAGPGEVSGEELPGVMPDDFPIPAGAVADYVSETEYSFSLNFIIDSGFDTTGAFYDEQLAA